jgi:hypothetical protein
MAPGEGYVIRCDVEGDAEWVDDLLFQYSRNLGGSLKLVKVGFAVKEGFDQGVGEDGLQDGLLAIGFEDPLLNLSTCEVERGVGCIPAAVDPGPEVERLVKVGGELGIRGLKSERHSDKGPQKSGVERGRGICPQAILCGKVVDSWV